MAAEWVAPAATGVAAVAGMFFTWLTGRQGRTQVERLARRAEEAAEHHRLAAERREAYFAAVRVAWLNLRIAKYQRQNEAAKLAMLEATWPKEERARLGREAVLAVEIFGSSEARQLLRTWWDAVDSSDEAGMAAAYEACVELARSELHVEIMLPAIA